MPLILIIVGAAVMISAFRGQAGALGSQLASDFSGSGSFLAWVGAFGVIGAMGYIKPLKAFSAGLMGLMLLTFVLKNGGLFTKLQQSFASSPGSRANTPVAAPASSSVASTIWSGLKAAW